MAGMVDSRIVLEIQQANDIVDVISEHVSLKKKGREMVGLCPFHDDHKPSMNVNSAKQIFKCFACGAGGDVFKFVQMRENLTFPQAIERLAERAGINIQPATYTRRQRTGSKKTNSENGLLDANALAKANSWAAAYFQKNLLDTKKGKIAREYLAKRQISKESINKWRIGLSTDSRNDLITTATRNKMSIKLLEQAGLTSGQNQDKFTNRLMFTITDVTGRVIGFGGRTLDETGAKYINSPTTVLFDKSNCLYGLEQSRHEIVSSGFAIVVEGYTDCIMAHQFGCSNVVATLGTSFTEGHARILRRFAKKAVLIFDSDTAGTEAANRALDICLSQRIDIRIAFVPEGKDPCDFLLAAGKEGFEHIIDDSVDVFRFKWERLKSKFNDNESTTDKKAAIEEYLDTMAIGFRSGNIPAIEYGLRVNQVSKIIGLDAKQLNTELNRRLQRLARMANRNNTHQAVVDYGRGRFAAAQREVIEVLLNKPELLETVKQKIEVGVFDVPILGQMAKILFEKLSRNINTELRELLAEVESVELSKSFIDLAQSGRAKGNYENRLKGALETIQRSLLSNSEKPIKTVEQQKQFLRQKHKQTGKENRNSVGMT